MKNKLKVFALVMVMAFSIIGCPMEDTKGSGKLRNFDIVGARTLMAVPKGSVSRAAADGESTETVLLKQLDDGSWVRVRMLNDTGEEIARTLPDYIYDATDDWLFIAWFIWKNENGGVYAGSWEAYLVNKSNGDVYDATQAGFPYSNVSTDKNGSIFYSGEIFTQGNLYSNFYDGTSSGIVKITAGKTQATAERIVTSDLFTVTGVAVDSDANILYHYNTDINFFSSVEVNNNEKLYLLYYYNDYSGGYSRIRTANGVTLPLLDGTAGLLITGYDGHIYTNINGKFSKVEVTGNTIDDIIISPVIFEIVNPQHQNDTPEQYISKEAEFVHRRTWINTKHQYSMNYDRGDTIKFIFPEKMVLCNMGVYDGRRIFIIYKNGNTPKCVYINSSFNNIKSITAGSKDIFIWADNSISTVDPET